MAYTPLEQSIEKIIAPSLESMGYTLVRVRFTEGSGKRKTKTLQIMAERTSDGSMTVDDCVEINNTVSALLDVEDPISGEYNLEISSPGMDRPLVKLNDFEKFKGQEIQVSTNERIDDSRKFKGTIKDVEGDEIVLTLADGGKELRIPYGYVHSAKLVVTEEMLRQAMKKTG